MPLLLNHLHGFPGVPVLNPTPALSREWAYGYLWTVQALMRGTSVDFTLGQRAWMARRTLKTPATSLDFSASWIPPPQVVKYLRIRVNSSAKIFNLPVATKPGIGPQRP